MDYVITCPSNCAIREYFICLHSVPVSLRPLYKIYDRCDRVANWFSNDFPARLHPLKYANASGWWTRPAHDARMPARIAKDFLLVLPIYIFHAFHCCPVLIAHLSPPFSICHIMQNTRIIWKTIFNVGRPFRNMSSPSVVNAVSPESSMAIDKSVWAWHNDRQLSLRRTLNSISLAKCFE